MGKIFYVMGKSASGKEGNTKCVRNCDGTGDVHDIVFS